MRRRFIVCDSRADAMIACPWAEIIYKTGGGYWCFESAADYRRWSGERDA